MSDMQFRAVRKRSKSLKARKRLIQNQWFDLEKRREPNHYAEQLKYNRGTRSARGLLRSLSVDGSCYVRVALWRTGSWFERSLHGPRKLSSRACQLSLYCSVRQSQN